MVYTHKGLVIPMGKVRAFLLAAMLLITIVLMMAPTGTSSVEPTGSRAQTLIVGPGQAYTTVQAAVDAANPGDTIRVWAGTYNGHIFLNKTVTLIGNGTTNTTLDGVTSGNTTNINAPHCNITGFKIIGYSTYPGTGVAINSDFNHIWDCYITNNYIGVMMREADNNTINDCNLSSNGGYGILMFGSRNNTFYNDTILLYYWHGIDLKSNSNNNTIDNVTVGMASEDGIFIQFAYDITVTNSSISSCGNSGFFIFGTARNRIEDCHSYNNHIGIRYGGRDSVILNNLVGRNANAGIYSTSGGSNTITGNVLVDNTDYGVYFWNNKDNVVYGNTFINNKGGGVQAYDDGTNNIWNTSTYGNYWDDKTSPDADNNGIVDTPYALAGSSSSMDNYPLALPYGQPFINVTDETTANEGELYSVQYDVLDLDTPKGSIIWTCVHNSSWLSFSPGQVLSGTPGPGDIGVWGVNITVTDGKHLDWHNFTITVVDVNDPPSIVYPSISTCYEDQVFWYVPSVTDADNGDVHTWSFQTNATFLSIDAATGNISGTPTNDDVGPWGIWLNVSDTGGLWDETFFILRVLNTQDAPQIVETSIPDGVENQPYWFDLSAVDVDHVDTTFTWSISQTNCLWLDIDNEGNLTGTPDDLSPGNVYVNVTVRDETGLGSYRLFIFDIANTPDAPYVGETIGQMDTLEDTPIINVSVRNWFFDLDGDVLSYSASSSENVFFVFHPNFTVDITPKENWAGTETVTVYGNDSVAEASQTFDIVVTEVNDAPTDPEIIISDDDYVEGQYQPVWANASDVDLVYGDELTFSWSSNRSGDQGEGAFVNLSLEAGTHEITLNITDKAGNWVVTTIVIEVDPEPVGTTDGTDGGSTDGGSTDGGSTDGGSTDGGSTDGGGADGGSNGTGGNTTDGTDGGSSSGVNPLFIGAGVAAGVIILVIVIAVILILVFVVLKKKPAEVEDGPEEAPPEAPSLTEEEQQAQQFAEAVGGTTTVDSPYADAEAASPGWDSTDQTPEFGQGLETQDIEQIDKEEKPQLSPAGDMAEDHSEPGSEDLEDGTPAGTCPTCGQPGTFYEEHQTYWCGTCQAWLP